MPQYSQVNEVAVFDTDSIFVSFREDWKPVLTVSSIIYGLQFLFLEPNPDDPLNKGKYIVSIKDNQ